MDREKLDRAVNTHIFYNVSEQVQRERELQSDVYDDITEAIAECSGEDDEIEVMSWFTVSERFASFAGDANEVVVKTPFGMIWGRQTFGQFISQDTNVQDIFKAMGEI